MEEDAGKSLHDTPDSATGTCLDFNRAGTPLVEIVTEPDIRSGAGRRRLLQPAARRADHCRRQRRQPRRGQPALRRQRLGAPGRHDRRSAPRSRSRTSTRSASCRRRSSTRSRGRARSCARVAASCRRRGCGTPMPAAPSRCAARKRRTTIAISPSPICRRCGSPRPTWRSGRRSCRSCPKRMRERLVAQYGLPAYDAGVLTQSAGAGALLRSGPRPPPATPRRPATGSWASCCACCTRRTATSPR